MSEPTADFVRKVLDYDPLTGVFKWKAGYARCVSAGRIAGQINGKGYACISIGGKQKAAHRMAWLYVYGEWPSREIYIDHVNGNKTDNRIANLRLATPSQNAQNRGRVMDGKKGTTFNKLVGKWQAQITPSGRTIYLGLFETREEAHAAYAKAASEHFGEFARVA